MERPPRHLSFVGFLALIFLSASLFLQSGCISQTAPLGSAENPVKLFFTPSVDAKVIEDNSIQFKNYLEEKTPYRFSISVPQSYIAVVESFGTKRADVAAINTFGYVMAHERYGVEARLTVLRHGQKTYQSEFLAKANGPIQGLKDFHGRKIAFVDGASTSGYLLPMKMLMDLGIKPSQIVFAGKHDSVITMIYQGAVDGGAAFYSPPLGGEMQEARRLVRTQYPDIESKVKIVALSEAIPNDPIVFRREMPEEMKEKIAEAFLRFVETPEGQRAFQRIYGVTGVQKASDADYGAVREMIRVVGQDLDTMMKTSRRNP